MNTFQRLTLTQLRECNHRAYATLRRLSTKRTFTYAIMTDGTHLVASVDDVRVAWDGTAWKVVPQPWTTLRSYASREGISEAQAYNRWRRGEIPGAYNVRGRVIVPCTVSVA